jgi:hypothetical protein
MPLDSIQHSKTYFLGKMKKFRESRFQIKQSPSVMYFAFFRTYYLRKTQKFSFDRRFVLQKASQDTFAFLSTNYQRNFRKFSDNRFFFPLGKISTESTNYKGGLMNYETPPDLGRPHRHTRYSLRQKSG